MALPRAELETSIVIALVAAGTTLLSGITSAAVSVYLNKRPSADSARVLSLDYLRHKIAELERHRVPVLETKHDIVQKPDDLSELEHIAQVTDDNFRIALKLFEKVQHYLDPSDADTIEQLVNHVSYTIAMKKTVFRGLAQPEELSQPMLSDEDMIQGMVQVSLELDRALSTELRRATKKIESILISAT